MPAPENVCRHEHDLVYRLLEATVLPCPSVVPVNRRFAGDYLLLLIEGGNGELLVDGSRSLLGPGSAVLLLPFSLFELRSSPSNPLHGYRVAFQALREIDADGGSVAFAKANDAFPRVLAGKLPKLAFAEAAQAAGAIAGQRRGDDETRRQPFARQQRFHRLLETVVAELDTPKQQEAKDAIASTIAYMRLHYEEPIGRSTLARIAGMSPWHYSRRFKEATGRTPSGMLESIRLDKAREHLLAGCSTVREVAQRVGYRDESRFRRKFKEAAGISPTMFIARKRDKVAVLSYHYAAHMLTLQAVPFATYVDRKREEHRAAYHDAISFHLTRVKEPDAHVWESHLQALAAARPEVILCDEFVDKQAGDSLAKIAPVVAIPWLGMTWRDHFREIAAFLARKRDAATWLSGYERKAELLRKRIGGSFGSERTLLLHIASDGLHVYGCRNGGSVLFQDLGITPAHNADAVKVCRELAVDELSSLGCERIMLVVDRDRESQRRWADLQASAVWLALPAVSRGTVHRIDEIPWLEYSPFAHTLVLDEAARIWR
ncbi:MAG: helix-turn-helix domain-containing protein [Paenibacillaceae bacterium]|nr:helix-turn-helix domain-containing protein [Paenibacillaceae bacterium]